MRVIQTYCCKNCFNDQEDRAKENNSEVKRIEILDTEKQKIICTFCFAVGVTTYADFKIEREVVLN